MKVIADYDGTNGIFSATLDIAGKCSVKSILTDEMERSSQNPMKGICKLDN